MLHEAPVEGRSVARAAIPRKPEGAWTAGGRRERDADYRSGKREIHCVFPVFKKMPVDESDIRKIIADIEATSWRLRKCIQVRELAAMHRLGKMCRLLMLEEQKTWKREVGFDRIGTAAEMDEKRFRTSLVLDPFFYRNMSNPRRPYTPDEFTLEMRVCVERLRLDIILSQPAPRPQCDPSPRRLPAVDTESEEPGTLRRSSANGTGSDKPGVSRAQTTRSSRDQRRSGSSKGWQHGQLSKARSLTGVGQQ